MTVSPFGRFYTCNRCGLQQFVTLFNYPITHEHGFPEYQSDDREPGKAMNDATMPPDWSEAPGEEWNELHFCPPCSWVRQAESDWRALQEAGEDA